MEKEVRELKYPDLYMGESFEDGYKGCRIMVIGHQAPATEGEEDKYKNNRSQFENDYKNNNIELVQKDILEEGYKTWKNRLNEAYLKYNSLISWIFCLQRMNRSVTPLENTSLTASTTLQTR